MTPTYSTLSMESCKRVLLSPYMFITCLDYILQTSIENGGARGVMVIIVGNGHSDPSSNPGQDWLYFT